MKKNTKIIISVRTIILVIIVLNIIFSADPVLTEEEIVIEERAGINIEVINDTVYVKDIDGVTHDTLTISEEFGEILGLNNIAVPKEVIDKQKFITIYDINFDGANDLAVLDGIGYGGVNMFYNYYIVNPETNQLEDYMELPHVSNFYFNETEQSITSLYRTGPNWHKDIYEWNGTGCAESLTSVIE